MKGRTVKETRYYTLTNEWGRSLTFRATLFEDRHGSRVKLEGKEEEGWHNYAGAEDFDAAKKSAARLAKAWIGGKPELQKEVREVREERNFF